MSTPTLDRPTDRPTHPSGPATAPLGSCLRFELVKLLGLWRVRTLLALCLLGPAAFLLVVTAGDSLPVDTVFGRRVPETGWAGALTVLAFSCSWGLPLITSLVAGDVFAAEDRLGTWPQLVLAVRSPARIFLAKAVASSAVLLSLVVAMAASAVVGGLLVSGDHPLIGLDGHALATGTAAGRVLLAWLLVLAPTAAFGSVGLLGSVLFGRSPVGLLLPALLAVALAVTQMLPLPLALRLALPSEALLSWRGLFTAPTQVAPLVVSTAVCLLWCAVATTSAYVVLTRRDFSATAYDGTGRLTALAAGVPLIGLVGAGVLVASIAGAGTSAGIGRAAVQDSLATSFGQLYRLQAADLGRPAFSEQQLRARARCDKGGPTVPDQGPGADWRCIVSWHVPGSTIVGHATYQLDLSADGKYVADGDGPKEVNGNFTVHSPSGEAPNPLWQFDGLVDLLPTSKG